MIYRDTGYLGSLINTLPAEESQYLDKGFLVKEWKFTTETNEYFVLQKKDRPDIKDIVYEMIDKYAQIFPPVIIQDAKRLVFDLNPQAKPQTFALSSLYLACKLNKKENLFHEKIRDIRNVYKDFVKVKIVSCCKVMTRVTLLASRLESGLSSDKLRSMQRVRDYEGEAEENSVYQRA